MTTDKEILAGCLMLGIPIGLMTSIFAIQFGLVAGSFACAVLMGCLLVLTRKKEN